MSVDLSGGNLGGPQPGGRVPSSEGGGHPQHPQSDGGGSASVVNQVVGTAKVVATRGVGSFRWFSGKKHVCLWDNCIVSLLYSCTHHVKTMIDERHSNECHLLL